MLSVLQVAQRAVDIYDPASTWDVVLTGLQYADSTVGMSIMDGCLVVAFRGTADRGDVAKDLEAALPHPAGELGIVADGFFQGVPQLFERLKALIPGHHLICTGHSLGAAQASLFAAYSALHGLPAHACVLMGCPPPGGGELNFWLRNIPAWYSFRNGHDPVCEVPPWTSHARPLIPLSEPGPADEGPSGWHHSALYVQGIAKLQLPDLA